jgi:hypothetical protein
MKFSFPYREEELTEFQLYLASKSPTVKKARNRNRLLLSIVYVAIGIMGMFRENNHLFALVFIALGILWYVLYPLWAGKFYARHFKKFVKNNYATRFGKEVVLDFTEDEVVIEYGVCRDGRNSFFIFDKTKYRYGDSHTKKCICLYR